MVDDENFDGFRVRIFDFGDLTEGGCDDFARKVGCLPIIRKRGHVRLCLCAEVSTIISSHWHSLDFRAITIFTEISSVFIGA